LSRILDTILSDRDNADGFATFSEGTTLMRLRSISAVTACSTLLLVAITNTATAGVVAFNNFAADGSYRPIGNWQGSADSVEVMLAQRFELSTAGQIELIEFGMTYRASSGTPNEVSLRIVPDVAGIPSDSAIWEGTFNNAAAIEFGSIATFPVSNGPILPQGPKYWITSSSPSLGFRPHTWWTAFANNTEPRGIKYLRGGGVFTENVWTAAYPSATVYGHSLRVTVLIPEPSTICLSLLLTAPICGLRRTLSWRSVQLSSMGSEAQ
jgi:hypothetical protein